MRFTTHVILIATLCILSLVAVDCKPVTAPIRGLVNQLYYAAVQQALVAYQLITPDFIGIELSLAAGAAAGLAGALSGEYDFVIHTGALAPVSQAVVPNVESYPILLNAHAPFYNLPSSVGTDTLVLTSRAACEIWRSNITMWYAHTTHITIHAVLTCAWRDIRLDNAPLGYIRH